MRGLTVTVTLRTAADFKTQTRQLSASDLLHSGDKVASIGVSNFLDEEPAAEAEPSLFAG